MREIIMTVISLSIGLLANAQFLYFNNVYELDNSSFSQNYKVFLRPDTSYLSVGNVVEYQGNEILTGTLLRLIDAYGNETYRNNVQLIPHDPAGVGNSNESVLKLSDSGFLQFHTASNGMQGYAPLLIRFDANLDTLWTKRILYGATPPDAGGYPNHIYPCGLTNISDTSFMMLTFNRWGWSANPDSLRFRFLTFDYQGNIIANQTHPIPQYLQASGIRKLSGDQLIVWGRQALLGDYQLFIWKTDLQGNILDEIILGNPGSDSACDDAVGAVLIPEDGVLVINFGYCLDDGGFQNKLMKDHLVYIDTNGMNVVDDFEYDLNGDEQLITSLSGMAVLESIEGNMVSVVRIVDGANNGKTYIMSTDVNGYVIWLQNYASGYSYYTEGLDDIARAHDGGYIATGSSEIILEDFSTVQKNWILKIDACGYEQPSGCPAVISVEEQTDTKVQLWPNPFHNLLKAVLPQDAQRVFVTDMTGRIVFEEKVYFPNQQWDLSKLERGAYLFKAECEDGRVIGQRIVKQ